ncbi:MFS-type transporter, Atg22 family [Terrimicrobium sacchariphilum]|uniref:MFS-type transporter, Atg22 family n=1 Tax=Terrimicrobium sacchariphilum TaxID=690879 RepID=A0A146GD13_TERSA|nr:MFS transporter [Terrimicrobium sacchariphilum]GAT35445.1 MFS-type transporter, Atg22 family [Terrimicrobium sacchariphilum]
MHPVIPCRSETSPRTNRPLWKAGTITYTTGGLVALFAWLLLGDFSWSMRDRSVGPMAMWYLNHLGVPNLLFGLLISSFPAFIGLVLGPVISVKSDRHRGRWGRRIPFLLVTTPMAAAGMIGIAVTPLLARWMHGHFPGQSEMVVSVACFAVFWATFEIATVASYSVFGGLVNDVVPQPLLGRFYGLFRAVSLIDGVVFNYWIMGHVPNHFTLILLSVGVFYGVSFFLVCLRVREGEYPPPPSPEPGRRWPSGMWSEVRTYCRECFSNPYYLAVFLFLMGAGQAFMPVNTFSIPYANSLGVNMDSYGKALALTFFISLLLAYPLGWLADIFHPLRVALVSLAGYFIVAICGAIFATTPQAFLVVFVMHGVLSGSYFTSAASLGARLFPRVKFAQFASAALAVTSLATMTLTPLMGAIIDQTGNLYRLTYVLGAFTAAVALGVGWYVHARFVQLGGPKAYVPPES